MEKKVKKEKAIVQEFDIYQKGKYNSALIKINRYDRNNRKKINKFYKTFKDYVKYLIVIDMSCFY